MEARGCKTPYQFMKLYIIFIIAQLPEFDSVAPNLEER